MDNRDFLKGPGRRECRQRSVVVFDLTQGKHVPVDVVYQSRDGHKQREQNISVMF